jgi:hypothetical protein
MRCSPTGTPLRSSIPKAASSGSVFPRFDSPSVFAALLDADAGHWSIRPDGPSNAARAYVASSMVLHTSFVAAGGEANVTDALALGESGDPYRLGQNAQHLLVRAVRCTRGEVRLRMEYRPRPEYGLVIPLLEPVPGGILAAAPAHVRGVRKSSPRRWRRRSPDGGSGHGPIRRIRARGANWSTTAGACCTP